MMAMPYPVLTVVTKNAPVVTTINFPVYEGHVESLDFSIRVRPYFSAQLTIAPASRYLVGFIHDLDRSRRRHDEVYDC